MKRKDQKAFLQFWRTKIGMTEDFWSSINRLVSWGHDNLVNRNPMLHQGSNGDISSLNIGQIRQAAELRMFWSGQVKGIWLNPGFAMIAAFPDDCHFDPVSGSRRAVKVQELFEVRIDDDKLTTGPLLVTWVVVGQMSFPLHFSGPVPFFFSRNFAIWIAHLGGRTLSSLFNGTIPFPGIQPRVSLICFRLG